MASRRSQPPQQPATISEGAALVRDYVVKLYDQRNGQGVDWPVIAEALFRASFDVLERLPDDRKKKLAGRVHEGSYRHLTGESMAPVSDGADAAPSSALAAALGPRPRPPH